MPQNRKAEVEAAQKALDLKNKKYQLELDTSAGKITLDMDSDVAPGHVANMLGLAKIGYYDGLVFHRIIKGFMIQGGGFDENLREKKEGLRPPIKNEASNGHGLGFTRW